MGSNEYVPQVFPFTVPPAPFIQGLAARLDTGVPRTVLDIGCGWGRHSLYLASLGHEVVGVNNDYEELHQAVEAQREVGRTACTFVQADAAKLPFQQPFDIVLCTETLHLMPKTTSTQVLTAMRTLTRQGGINAVSGYLVKPGMVSERNHAQMFLTDELRMIYARAGWQVIDYREDPLPEGTPVTTKDHVQTKAQIVAQRPW